MRRPGIAAGYLLVGLAMFANWQLESPEMIVTAAFMAVIMSTLLYADFSKFKATGPGGSSVEVERLAKVEEALAEVEELSLGPTGLEVDSSETVVTSEEITLTVGEVGASGQQPTAADSRKTLFPVDIGRRLAEKAKASEAERRAALERLVAEAIEWGWTAGKQDSPRPVPQVDWSEEGHPRLDVSDESAKVRMRNQACPCGSGRKYKHCHG